MRRLFAFILLLAFATTVSAQTAFTGLRMVPLGYCQLSSLGSATALASCSGGIPTGATVVYVEAEAQAVRYRDDGVAPSSSVGMPIASGGFLLYSGTLSALQFIEQTSTAKLNVLFYR